VYANEQCKEVMGYKREEFYAPDFNFLNLIAPKSIELVKTNNIKHIQGEDVAPYEYSIITKGGNKIEAIITTTLINYEGESAILGVITDITERKRAEEALKEAEEKYRDLLDNTNDLIQSVTPDGRFRYVNDAWRNALGYSEEELSNLRLFDIIHPDYLQHCEMTFQKLLSGKNVGRIKAAFVSKMGSVIMVEGDVNVKFMDGKPVYTRGIFRDITKSAYLEEHVFRLSSAISMSTDCIVITDCNAKIIDVNQKMLELYGANSEDELIGRHFLEIIDPEKRAMVNMDVKDIIEKGYLESREYNMVSKQRHKFTMQMSTSLVKAANGEPMGIVRVGNPSGKLN
jgi:PAS domain S-box-containing protein